MVSIVTISDVRSHLNITGFANDDELTRLMDGATAFVERHIGPVVQRTITETVMPTGNLLILSAPVISVTSMTAAYGYPGSYVAASWSILGRSLVAPYGSRPAPWPITVVYVGGRTPVPADLYQATLDYIKWRWLSQRGATPIPGTGDEFAVAPSAEVPYKVMEVINGYRIAAIA